jgi:hypothetical protein
LPRHLRMDPGRGAAHPADTASLGPFQAGTGRHGELWPDPDSLYLRPGRVATFAGEFARGLSPHDVDAVRGPGGAAHSWHRSSPASSGSSSTIRNLCGPAGLRAGAGGHRGAARARVLDFELRRGQEHPFGAHRRRRRPIRWPCRVVGGRNLCHAKGDHQRGQTTATGAAKGQEDPVRGSSIPRTARLFLGEPGPGRAATDPRRRHRTNSPTASIAANPSQRSGSFVGAVGMPAVHVAGIARK